jgi:hypothetical protein
MMIYPMLSFLTNFKSESKLFSGVWNRERWDTLLKKPVESDFEQEFGDFTSQEGKSKTKLVSKLRIEPEKFTLPIKKRHEGHKIKLDQSSSSMYFVSLISYKKEKGFDKDLLEFNCIGKQDT